MGYRSDSIAVSRDMGPLSARAAKQGRFRMVVPEAEPSHQEACQHKEGHVLCGPWRNTAMHMWAESCDAVLLEGPKLQTNSLGGHFGPEKLKY